MSGGNAYRSDHGSRRQGREREVEGWRPHHILRWMRYPRDERPGARLTGLRPDNRLDDALRQGARQYLAWWNGLPGLCLGGWCLAHTRCSLDGRHTLPTPQRFSAWPDAVIIPRAVISGVVKIGVPCAL